MHSFLTAPTTHTIHNPANSLKVIHCLQVHNCKQTVRGYQELYRQEILIYLLQFTKSPYKKRGGEIDFRSKHHPNFNPPKLSFHGCKNGSGRSPGEGTSRAETTVTTGFHRDGTDAAAERDQLRGSDSSRQRR
ncbi:hypothetical protein AAHA92_06590 [Salvia divinorum]|uniref:Uncharacterized protein n=1 Tax=Salvia divinorum TaxID=28513 RepID=A0ABD1I659_SALDI